MNTITALYCMQISQFLPRCGHHALYFHDGYYHWCFQLLDTPGYLVGTSGSSLVRTPPDFTWRTRSTKYFFLFFIFYYWYRSHDIDHPGHSQNLEIARESELALRYNDTAVLESYHAHKTFQLLKSDDMNIFCNLTQDQYKYCRKSILKCILGTDMSKHFLLLENLMNRVGRAKNKDISMGSSEHDKSFGRLSSASASSSTGMLFDRHDDGDRLELLEMIVHTADLSGQASPYEEAKQWGDKVISEFKDERLQHEKEGFSPPAFMDGIDSRYDELMLQSSFIKNIVQPLWEWMHEALGSLDEPVEYLQRNREKYEKEAASIETG